MQRDQKKPFCHSFFNTILSGKAALEACVQNLLLEMLAFALRMPTAYNPNAFLLTRLSYLQPERLTALPILPPTSIQSPPTFAQSLFEDADK